MKPSPKCFALIQQFEGFSPLPYRCPAGLRTIGYGHVLTAREGNLKQVSETEAQTLLEQDVQRAASAVARLITTPLTQEQFDALVSFTFNLGSGALQRSRLRRCINRGEHEAVPAELLRWVRGGGRVLPGLVARRRAEAELYARAE